jgi:hypothetical protein
MISNDARNQSKKDSWKARFYTSSTTAATQRKIYMKNVLLLVFIVLQAYTQAAAADYFFVSAKHSNKCLHQQGSTQVNGGPVTQWECLDQANMKLEEVPAGDGYIFLRFAHSGKCVHQQGASQANDAIITQWDCVDQPNLKIKKTPAGDGYFFLAFQHSGKCIHQQGGVQANAAVISQYECIDRPNLKWRFKPMSSPAVAATVPANQTASTYPATASVPAAAITSTAPTPPVSVTPPAALSAATTTPSAGIAAGLAAPAAAAVVLSRFESKMIEDAVVSYLKKEGSKAPVVQNRSISIEGTLGLASGTVKGGNNFNIFLKKENGKWAGIFDGAIGPGDCQAMGFSKASKICAY